MIDNPIMTNFVPNNLSGVKKMVAEITLKYLWHYLLVEKKGTNKNTFFKLSQQQSKVEETNKI